MNARIFILLCICLLFSVPPALADCAVGMDGCGKTGCPEGFECARPPGGCENERQCLRIAAAGKKRMTHVRVTGQNDVNRCKGGTDRCSKSGCAEGWICVRPPDGCADETQCVLAKRPRE